MQTFMISEKFVRKSIMMGYYSMRILNKALHLIWERSIPVGIFIGFILAIIMVDSLFSGIPEPGIILNGIVRVDDCLPSTCRELIWTFTPVIGGDTLSISTELKEVEGQTGLYSYKVLIPFVKEIQGFPTLGNTIIVSNIPVEYSRNVNIAGTDFSKTDIISISLDDRGTVKNISLVF